MDWNTGTFDIRWTADSPLASGEEPVHRDCEVADVRLLDGGVLILRVKEDGRLVYCAPHTWQSVTTVGPRKTQLSQRH
jgi:hypothetical protein